MKKFLKILIAFQTIFLLGLPFSTFAQSLENNGEIIIEQAGGGNYNIILTLQLTGYSPAELQGKGILAVLDDDEINHPYTSIIGVPVVSNGGYIDVDLPVAYDPTNHFLQFFLVNTSEVVNIPGGYTAFNIDTFPGFVLPSGISHLEGNNGNNTDNENQVPNNDNTDNETQVPENQQTLQLQNYNWNTLQNPFAPNGQEFNILNFFAKLFGNLVKIALPILVLFIIYSGFRFVEARGNDKKLADAKQNFLYVIIGGALILGAWVIATAIRGTVNEISEPVAFLINIINLV
ncbi:MAG: hypothetical protein IT284_02675 [Bacteroidetes bacterium]|nr:hypothetical protein [Bacteroidota bacterium]